MDFFNHVPSNYLLGDREDNEAYCMAYPGNEYIVYFPAEGSVFLDAQPGIYEMRWLQIHKSKWIEPFVIELPSDISAPDNDHWVVILKKM